MAELKRSLVSLMAILVMVAVMACANAPVPEKFVLPVPEGDLRAADNDVRVLLYQIRLPAYARTLAISTLQPDLSIDVSRQAEWASPPSEAIASVLTRHIENVSGATVALRPVTAAFKPDARVAVLFDTFARLPNNGALIEGQIRIETENGSTIQRFSFERTADGGHTTDYVLATSRSLAQLAELIESRLQL